MSDSHIIFRLSEPDREALEALVEDFLERLIDNLPDTTQPLNPEHIYNDKLELVANPNYVRAWVRFDALGGQAMELPAGSVSWHPEIRWERHDNGRCWEVEPRYLSERRMRQLEEQFKRQSTAHLMEAINKNKEPS